MSLAQRAMRPWAWVPSAYLAEGIPFAMVIWVAGTMFKDLGRDDGEITLATASIGIAWSLKPLWAAFLDMFKTKRFFVLGTEYLMGVLLAGIAFAIQMPDSFWLIIAGLWVLAFTSATQDICVDGVYITSLDARQQASWIGIQGMAWNSGRIFATAVVVWAAGALQEDAGLEPRVAWCYAMLMSGAVMAALGLYHTFVLPTGST